MRRRFRVGVLPCIDGSADQCHVMDMTKINILGEGEFVASFYGPDAHKFAKLHSDILETGYKHISNKEWFKKP